MDRFLILQLQRVAFGFGALLTFTHSALGLVLDGSGHYSLVGETQTQPAFSKSRGTFQAINQYFRLDGEARLNDRSSVFMHLRIFDKPRAAYLGDTAQPNECSNTDQGGANCKGAPQDTNEPAYKPYHPYLTAVYAQYAFDYCLLEAGRRPRQWGLGIFLNSGTGAFDTTESIFDGVTCKINIQKSQTLGLSFGYDKLSETGVLLNVPRNPDGTPQNQGSYGGATDPYDDIDQYFFAIEFDDRKANAGSAFTKDIGIYFANVIGHYRSYDEIVRSDVKFLDLFTGFYLPSIVYRNEVLIRLGKSPDPAFARLGGRTISQDAPSDDPSVTNVQSLGFAGALDFTLSRSGSYIGPAEFNQGNASRHAMLFEYAYAPGSSSGYYSNETGRAGDFNPNQFGLNQRFPNDTSRAEAMAFNRNYKPALILFNGHPEIDDLHVDGAFDPGRVMNAVLLALAYRYESLQAGNFETKLITARQVDGMPGDVHDYYAAHPYTDTKNGGQQPVRRPGGYGGMMYGYELDLKYDYSVGREADVGVAGAFALPGNAWDVDPDTGPQYSLLLQTFATFKF